MRHIYMLGEGV